jgi:hypothetical protein
MTLGILAVAVLIHYASPKFLKNLLPTRLRAIGPTNFAPGAEFRAALMFAPAVGLWSYDRS